MEKSGALVFLTPYSGDEGIDVIGFKESEIQLVQCKHTLWDTTLDVEAAEEVIDAFDGYRARRLRQSTKGRRIVPALITNGSAAKSMKIYARERGLRVVDHLELLRLVEEAECSLLEVEAMEHRRLASMFDVQAALDGIVQN
jgi:hypothetical protein